MNYIFLSKVKILAVSKKSIVQLLSMAFPLSAAYSTQEWLHPRVYHHYRELLVYLHKYYCCPLKSPKRKNPIRNADEQVLRICFCKSKHPPPLFEQRWFRRYLHCLFQHFWPVFFRLFKKSIAVDIIHQHYSYHGS